MSSKHCRANPRAWPEALQPTSARGDQSGCGEERLQGAVEVVSTGWPSFAFSEVDWLLGFFDWDTRHLENKYVLDFSKEHGNPCSEH